MPQFIRQTAVPCTLSEIAQGEWVQGDAAGVQTQRGMISRASVIGVMIGKQENGFLIDDGTHQATVRQFEPKPILANVGDIVLVIGKLREYNGERYLNLEICKRIRNTAWVQYRRKELEQVPEPVFVQPVIEEPVAVSTETKNPYDLIVTKLRELDEGTGVQIDDLIQALPEAEKFVRTLIEEGEIFEIKPGRLKVLE